jgi:hypothetical protein
MPGELAEAQDADVPRGGATRLLTRFIHQNAALAQDGADGYLFGVQ